jgi:hypothetical protein
MRLPVLGFAVLCAGCLSAPGNYVPARPSIAVTPTLAPTPWWISPGEAACPSAGAPPQRGQVVRAATESYCEADGVAHGPETRFYPDGGVAETGMLDHGVRVGPWTRFFVDGTIADYGTYTKGRPTGVWSTFYPSGREHERRSRHPARQQPASRSPPGRRIAGVGTHYWVGRAAPALASVPRYRRFSRTS